MKRVLVGFFLALGLLGESISSRAQGASELLAGTTAQWWQYVISIPTTVNPLLDATGDNCMVGQRNPIVFLVGTFSGGPPAPVRTCSVPPGEWLFFPVINSVQINTPRVCGQTGSLNVAQLRSLAAPLIDSATNMSVTLDGKSMNNLIRVKSDVFATTIPADNIFNFPCGGGPGAVPPGIYAPSVDDGYYVLLSPLSVRDHTLHIHAESGDFKLDVTYILKVVHVQLK
jgi:hypothetical protein